MPPLADRLAERKQVVADIRTMAQRRLDEGSSGVLIGATICDRVDQFIVRVAEESIQEHAPGDLERLARQTAIIGVGGTGRGIMCPYSDVDLMLLTDGNVSGYDDVVSTFIQALWDVGLKPGQSVRTVDGAIKLAKEDDKTSTSFVKTRLLWGSDTLAKTFARQFDTKILKRQPRQFVEGCVRARESEFTEDRPAIQELQPNVKTSRGGLRDLHLIEWIAAAYHGTTDTSVLQLQRVITPDDAIRLREAEEFLTRLRVRLHLLAGGPDDTLTRGAQLAIADQEGYEDSDTQRDVEQLMQEYFRHSSAVATIAERFVARHRTAPLVKRVWKSFRERRGELGLYFRPDSVDMPPGLTTATESLEAVLTVYDLASARNLTIAPRLTEAIRAAALTFDDELTDRGAELFREILKRPESLPAVLRHMHDTGVLDHVIPAYRGIRSLLQFNQYHSFTVDEHTLRAVEQVCSFANDDGPLGKAYERIRNRDVLHLSVFLHDIGKGRPEDHSQLGSRIALDVGRRLGYDDGRTERLSTLVLEHLEMADLAFRRDITDQRLLVEFANRLGSPRTLIKLYLLTAADIMSVGPGTWTPWKSELLTDLFERAMVIVSGRNYGGFEEEKIASIKAAVAKLPPENFDSNWPTLVEAEFDRFPTHYLMNTSAERIAGDLAIVVGPESNDIHVRGFHDDATGVTEYRVIMPEKIGGCFQNMCASLTARNFEILSADIATTTDGFVIDTFQVCDTDFITLDETSHHGTSTTPDAQPIPAGRIEEMTMLFREVLSGQRDPSSLFARFERFGAHREDEALPSGLTSRVRIDNDTSTDRTIIDVFTQDRRGLLYFLAKSIGELNLSVELAKIATHFDQVVDVFYVTERDGSKLSHDRVQEVRQTLTKKLAWFDNGGFREFRRA